MTLSSLSWRQAYCCDTTDMRTHVLRPVPVSCGARDIKHGSPLTPHTQNTPTTNRTMSESTMVMAIASQPSVNVHHHPHQCVRDRLWCQRQRFSCRISHHHRQG
eukprot:scaffold29974_cov60-Cyclotella_meneghiniana.AAC.8